MGKVQDPPAASYVTYTRVSAGIYKRTRVPPRRVCDLVDDSVVDLLELLCSKIWSLIIVNPSSSHGSFVQDTKSRSDVDGLVVTASTDVVLQWPPAGLGRLCC